MIDGLQRALIPLSEPPAGPGWNRALMADLLGDAPKKPASVLVGLREGAQPRLILTVRNGRLNAHAGQVAFPGGGRDADDRDAVATALRESEEEIGLDPALVSPLGFLDVFETVSGFRVTPVVARIDGAACLRPAPGEVDEVFEVPLAFFLDPTNRRRHAVDRRGRRYEMTEFVHGGHRIWGATAAMLLNLLERMGRA